MDTSVKAHAVYKMGGRNKVSYGIVIPKEFAKEMGIAGKKKASVRITLVNENGRKPYCIVEKLEI